MELYDLVNPAERLLAKKADLMHVPLGGTMELTPLCNMNCRMCYIRLSSEQMIARGRMLSCDEWLHIAEEARENGVLYLLLTGGEPLLFPEFERLYCALSDMGFILTINTNGTLINTHIADVLARRPCKRLNLTLYGPDNETYMRLCQNPKGFSQIMHAAALLKERGLIFRFNCSVTPDNKDSLEKITDVAKSFEVPLEVSSYMFPPVHRGVLATDYLRLSPKQAARSQLDSYLFRAAPRDVHAAVINTLNLIRTTEQIEKYMQNPQSAHLTCRAGRSGFWINWKGELLPCGMFEEPKINLLTHPFDDAWSYIVEKSSEIRSCEECRSCAKQKLCMSCSASCLSETGSFTERPDYLCRMTDELIRILLEKLSEDERKVYEMRLSHG